MSQVLGAVGGCGSRTWDDPRPVWAANAGVQAADG